MRFLAWVPWYAWVIAWLLTLWLSSLEHALGRKRKFDSVSEKFFKAYLGHLLQEGYGLFERSGDKDFYSRINEWQHKVIEALGIGMGHQESARFFEKMDHLHPLSTAFRESQDRRSNEPLCLWLQGHLDELMKIREGLEGPQLLEAGEPGPSRPKEPAPGKGPDLPKLPSR